MSISTVNILQEMQNAEQYPRFADAMTKYGYDWEPMTVVTEDDYVLTTFHITGKTGNNFAPWLGSVLIQHGDSQDGTSWITGFDDGVGDDQAFQLKLVDAGYDVYIGNNRGTMYSWGHKTLDAAVDAEYWDWTWFDMGMYDDVANIEAIKKATGEDKIFYIGYSQGTGQMHYALSKSEQTFVDSLYKVVHLAPCFVPKGKKGLKPIFNRTLMQVPSYGVYSFNGPNWDQDLKTICDNFGDKYCKLYTANTGSQGQSVKSEQHWIMNIITGRFQEYAENWQDGVFETELIPMSNIKQMPMTFFIGTADPFCTYDIASQYIPQIQSKTNIIDCVGKDHGYFGSGANDDWFMQNLIEQLTPPTQ